MLYKEIKMSALCAPLSKSGAMIQCYLHAGETRPGIIICPGGAYMQTSEREGGPVANAFCTEGFNAFVLHYSVAPAVYPDALTELFILISTLRKNTFFCVDPDRIAVLGFSAGGHLAGCAGTMWDGELARKLFEDPCECRPNVLGLCYPVINCENPHCCADSFINLLGREPSKDEAAFFSIDKNVTAKTPPAYIFHTSNDPVVPHENSLLMAAALAKQNIPYELHIFKNGAHGLSLATVETADNSYREQHINPDVARWFDECVDFMLEILNGKM